MKQKQVTSNIFNIRKKSTKINLIILSVTLIFCFLLIPDFSFAHSGSLDSNGGHWDRSTNEYHYHHGYEAHQHPDGVCPYNFVDNANRSNGDSSGRTTYKHTTAQQKRTTQHSTKPSQNNDYSENSMLTDTFFVAIIILVLVAGIVAICRYKKAKKKKETLKTFANVLKYDLGKIKEEETAIRQKIYYLLSITRKKNHAAEHIYFNELFSKQTLEELCKAPKGIKIINSNIIDESSTEEYGRYTAYLDYYKQTIHFSPDCTGNFLLPVDLLNFNHYIKENQLCELCYSSERAGIIENIPQWYRNYTLYLKIAKIYNIDLHTIQQIHYTEMYGGKSYNELLDLPEDISFDGAIMIDKCCSEKYGRFTGYTTRTGQKIHLKNGCCGANVPCDITETHLQLCSKCYNSEKRIYLNNSPDWYKKYKCIKEIKRVYKIY